MILSNWKILKKWRTFNLLVFANCSFQIVFILLYWSIVNEMFWEADAKPLRRSLIRSISVLLSSQITLEFGWQLTRLLVTECGLSEGGGAIVYAYYATINALQGRLMQGTADTPLLAIQIQIASCFSDIYTAESLLRGETPLYSLRMMFQWLSRCCFVRKNDQRERKLKKGKSEFEILDDAEKEEREGRIRKVFCSSALMTSWHNDASSILCVGALLLSFSSNLLGPPGTGALKPRKIFSNVFVGIVGHLLTNVVVNLLSWVWPKRYCIDLTVQYRTRTRWKYWLLMILVSLVQSNMLIERIVFNTGHCFTSSTIGGKENDWVFTLCPKPPKATNDMARVGDFYAHKSDAN